MKVVHVSFWDNKGGAGLAGYRLHKAMISSGIDSKMLVFEKGLVDDDSIISLKTPKSKILLDIYNRLYSIALRSHRPYIGNFSIQFFGLSIHSHSIVKEADVIYFHWWYNSMVSYTTLEKLLYNKKVIFMLHDMASFTGGCHHSFECIKYRDKCYHCDLLKDKKKYGIAYFQLKKKYSVYHKSNNLVVCAISKWVEECAANSYPYKNVRVEYIPTLVDQQIYIPLPKEQCREELGLPLDSKLVLFGSVGGGNNPYKGFEYLRRAIDILPSDVDLVVYGGKDDLVIPGRNVFNLGFINSEKVMCQVYSAVDVFVMPSLAETFGQAATESLSCGTPVVSFPVGGLNDIVLHKKNGYVARLKDSEDLSLGIQWVLDNKDSLSNTICRESINIFSREVILEKHLKLLKTIM